MDAESILASTLETLRRGSRPSPPALPDALTDTSLNRKVRDTLAAHVSSSDLNVLEECGRNWNTALRLASKGAFAEADEMFSAASRMFQRDDLAFETKLLCESFFSAAASFLDYRLKRWDSARRRIYDGLACDEKLEREFGYSLLHLHRLTLLENLCRVERKAGHTERAASLAGALLAYLSGSSAELNLPGSWGWQQLSLPIGNIRFLFSSISGDFAQSIACIDIAEARRLFALSSGFMGQALVGEYVDTDALHWFEAKSCLLSGNAGEFLVHANGILSNRSGQVWCAKVWCATLLDTMTLCESSSGLSGDFSNVVKLFDKARFWTAPIKAHWSSISALPALVS